MEFKKKTKGHCELLKIMLTWFRYYFDLLVDKVFGIIHDYKKQTVCSVNNPLLLESAMSLAEKIRNREVKSENVVRAFIERIKAVNPILNALVDERFEDALEEARKLDKKIEVGEIDDIDFREKSLLGVPFTSKESTAAKGMSHTFGIFARKGKKAKEDSDIVRLIKQAGGILLGVTNIPQLNMWQETDNPLFGRTNNPYNTTRNVGGSSGGESSIIAAGGSPFGLGTDIGGSLRIPSFMCGLFGHKPTSNIISTRGLTFRTGKEKNTMVVSGPITRYADDIIPILKILADDNVYKLNLDKPVDIEDITFYYIEDPQDPYVSLMRDEMKHSFKKVIEYIEEISPIKPKKVEFSGIQYGGKLWRYWMTQESDANLVKDLTNREFELNPMMEIMKYAFMNRNFSLSTIFNLINRLLPAEKADWAEKETRKLKEEILAKLGDKGVLLYPSAPWPASYHYTAFLRPWNFNLFSIWNVLKLPCTQIPLGLSSQGLPLGIQAVTSPYNDRLTIAVAKNLENRFGGYVPPFALKTVTS